MRIDGLRTARAATAGFAILTWTWLFVLILGGIFGIHTRRHHLEAAGIGLGVAIIAVWLLATISERHHPADVAAPVAWRWLVACAAAGASLYLWTFDIGLLSDDYLLLDWARAGDFTPDLWVFLRPVPLVLWRVIDLGASPWGQHVLNVLLHGCNILLVGLLAGRLFGGASSLAAAALFAAVPAHTETVTWGAGVFDLAMLWSILVALNAWFAPVSSAWRAVGVLVPLCVGLYSKETAVVLPVLLLLLDLATRPEPRSWSRWITVAVAWAMVLAMVLWRAAIGGLSLQSATGPEGRYALKEMVIRPLRTLAAPVRMEDVIPLLAWIGGLCFAVLVGVLLLDVVRPDPVRGRTRARAVLALAIGLGWPLVAVTPLLRYFYVATNLEGSRYLYAPAVGMAIAASASLSARRAPRRNGIAAGAIALLVVTWIVSGYGERRYWREAADLRDTVLTDVKAAARAGDCATFALHAAPDNVHGVYVFRLGLGPALASVLEPHPGSRACEGTWTGTTVIMNRPPAPLNR